MRRATRWPAAAYDLILLDLMLPDGRGIGFLKALRARGDVTPVIILTALDQVSDRIEGLNAGADDYLVKPFDLAELSARIGSVARRYTGNPNPIITHGPLDIDLAARSIRRDGKPVQLTAREWALFEAFLARPGQLLSKAQLEEKLYAFDAEVESNTIEVHVSRLRKKLGAARHRDRARPRLPAGRAMRLPRSLQARLGLSLGLLLTLLWIARRHGDGRDRAARDGRGLRLRPAGNRAAPPAAGRRSTSSGARRRASRSGSRRSGSTTSSSPTSSATPRGASCCSRTRRTPPCSRPGTGRASARPRPTGSTATRRCRGRSASPWPSRWTIARRSRGKSRWASACRC